MGGITAWDPLAANSVSYFSDRPSLRATVLALGSTLAAETPKRMRAFMRSKNLSSRMFMPSSFTVPSRKWVSPTRE